MDLGDDGELASLQAFDDPEFPQWLAAVELLGDDPARQCLELVIVAGPRQAGVADVEIEVERVVVDPDRCTVVRNERRWRYLGMYWSFASM